MSVFFWFTCISIIKTTICDNRTETTTSLEDLTTLPNETEEGNVNCTSEQGDNLKQDTPVAEKLRKPNGKCYSNGLEGVCLSAEECYNTEGQGLVPCGHTIYLICCIWCSPRHVTLPGETWNGDNGRIIKFHPGILKALEEKGCYMYSETPYIDTCGDISKQRVSYFRSPNFPLKYRGSLACDYDIVVQPSTCAVRVDFIAVTLARRLGGVCDIDQLFILNSVDGPTAGQCGPLTGYSTTVAVKPGQIKPVKLALLIQNEASYYWDIKITQLSCKNVKYFKAPQNCGEVKNDVYSASGTNFLSGFNDIQWLQDIRHWKNQIPQHTWWNYPEPIFNTYYYKTTKKHLLQGVISGRRIISGTDAYLGEFPWAVAIGMDNMFFCGGALLTEKLVVTAAHCLMARDTPIGSLIVHLGDLDLTSDNETVHELRMVSRVLYHSHFHPFLLANDIAMLQLESPIKFSDTIQPICLPKSGRSYTGEKGTVVGWGVTSFPMGEPSPILQKLEVETLPNYQCSRLIDETVTAGMLCASPTHKQGTCFGDSGGPLTIQDKTGQHILIGVVSFGVTGCAVRPAFPDLYTRVSEYLKWIDINAL